MTELGLASRREADEWIAPAGCGSTASRRELGQRVRPERPHRRRPARAATQQAQQVTILLQQADRLRQRPGRGRPRAGGRADHAGQPLARGPRAAAASTPAHLRGLAPAGRLDIDSIGLLVLTQDGRVAKRLIGEDSRIEKEYLVRVAAGAPGSLPTTRLARLRHGLELDGQPLKPAQVSWQNDDQLRFVLREGKKRQIRRMCELVGLKVLGLQARAHRPRRAGQAAAGAVALPAGRREVLASAVDPAFALCAASLSHLPCT